MSMLAQTVVDKGSQVTLRPGRRMREEGFVDFCTIAAQQFEWLQIHIHGRCRGWAITGEDGLGLKDVHTFSYGKVPEPPSTSTS
jgi:hypothetical protein